MTPFIIAEISANHCGSLNAAHALIDHAHDAGANAIKLQTYKPENMVSHPDYLLMDGPWAGRKLIDLYREAQTPWEWHQELFDHAIGLRMTAFSTAYDREAVDFLETIDYCPMYKIASFEANDLDLIRYVALRGKPMIVSTGMASFREIQNIARIAEWSRVKLTLMKCTSSYPAKPSDINLTTIRDMARYFHCDIGLSDHTLGSAVACAAVAMGATVFEKHLTLSRSFMSPDSGFSTEPDEFAQYVADIHDAYLAVGGIEYGPTSAEASSYRLRRSLYYKDDLEKGTMLMRHHIKTARPALGLAPEHLPLVIGQTLLDSVKAGQPVLWGQMSE